jgi:hypothetical protein
MFLFWAKESGSMMYSVQDVDNAKAIVKLKINQTLWPKKLGTFRNF